MLRRVFISSRYQIFRKIIEDVAVAFLLQVHCPSFEEDRVTAIVWQEVAAFESQDFVLLERVPVKIREGLYHPVFDSRHQPVDGSDLVRSRRGRWMRHRHDRIGMLYIPPAQEADERPGEGEEHYTAQRRKDDIRVGQRLTVVNEPEGKEQCPGPDEQEK